jgi:phospholipid transport system substrate-binding protein
MRSFRLLLLFLLFLSEGPLPVAAASPPAVVVDRLHERLLATMKQADTLGMSGRYTQLQPVLEQSFDFERMIAAAAGSHWATASDEERQRLLEAFTNLSVTTYAARFNGFAGESFEITGERSGPRETVLVDTLINRSEGQPAVPITYVMSQRQGEWRIVDVLLDRSISELAVRRSEYNQLLRTGGTEKLAETLDEKAAELREP